MSNTRTPTEKIGIRYTKQVVEEFWNSRFQDLAATNDDGIDGIIFIGKHGEVTGEILFVQIKTGKSYRYESTSEPGIIKIKLGTEHIKKHRSRWATYPGPVILIYVDNSTDKFSPKSWWCDLKAERSYSLTAKSIVLVNKENTFGEHTKGHFKNLCTHHTHYQHQLIRTNAQDFSYLKLKHSVKENARQYYQLLCNKPVFERSNPLLGEILISRVGWRHMTRKGRRVHRMLQSFQLLGALLPMINNVTNYEILGKRESVSNQSILTVLDYIGLKAKVTFPHRYQSVVVIVLKRKQVVDEQEGTITKCKIWFYTIYESRSGEVMF